MPLSLRNVLRIIPVLAPLCTAPVAGCVTREYVTSTVLYDISASDPDLRKLRVYPNATFIAVYSHSTNRATDVSRAAGTVRAGSRRKELDSAVKRKLPGAIVKAEELDGQPVLWVTFDEACAEVDCSFGFVRSSDGLFRLFKVPLLEGYSEPEVYRKRTSERRRMTRTKIYAKTDATAVYFTTRGFRASVALEVKTRENVDIETVSAPQRGVRPGNR